MGQNCVELCTFMFTFHQDYNRKGKGNGEAGPWWLLVTQALHCRQAWSLQGGVPPCGRQVGSVAMWHRQRASAQQEWLAPVSLSLSLCSNLSVWAYEGRLRLTEQRSAIQLLQCDFHWIYVNLRLSSAWLPCQPLMCHGKINRKQLQMLKSTFSAFMKHPT